MKEAELAAFTDKLLHPYQYYWIIGAANNRQVAINPAGGLWQIWRNQAGKVRLGDYWMQLGVAGSTDRVGSGIDGIAIYIEFKKDGKQRIKGAQETFQQFASKARHYHIFDRDGALAMRDDLIKKLSPAT